MKIEGTPLVTIKGFGVKKELAKARCLHIYGAEGETFEGQPTMWLMTVAPNRISSLGRTSCLRRLGLLNQANVAHAIRLGPAMPDTSRSSARELAGFGNPFCESWMGHPHACGCLACVAIPCVVTQSMTKVT